MYISKEVADYAYPSKTVSLHAMSSNPLPEKLWEHDDVKATKIYAFMRYVNKNYRQQICKLE